MSRDIFNYDEVEIMSSELEPRFEDKNNVDADLVRGLLGFNSDGEVVRPFVLPPEEKLRLANLLRRNNAITNEDLGKLGMIAIPTRHFSIDVCSQHGETYFIDGLVCAHIDHEDTRRNVGGPDSGRANIVDR